MPLSRHSETVGIGIAVGLETAGLTEGELTRTILSEVTVAGVGPRGSAASAEFRGEGGVFIHLFFPGLTHEGDRLELCE